MSASAEARYFRANLLLLLEKGEQPILDKFADKYMFRDKTIHEFCSENNLGVYTRVVTGSVTKQFVFKQKVVHSEETPEPVRSDGVLNSYTFYIFYKRPEDDDAY